jgi:hypothetical protein
MHGTMNLKYAEHLTSKALKTTQLKFYKITDVSTLMYAVNN